MHLSDANPLLSKTAVENARELHAELFAAYPEAAVKTVSRLEREAKELPNRSLAYGEIPFQTVDDIFQLVPGTCVRSLFAICWC